MLFLIAYKTYSLRYLTLDFNEGCLVFLVIVGDGVC